MAKSTETTDKEGGLGDDHLGLGGDHDDLNEDEGGFVEAVHRSKRMRAVRGIKGAREGEQGKARQGKGRQAKARQGKGVETFPADAQWSSEEFSHRKTFRAGAQPQKNIQGARPLKEGLG